MAVPSGNPNKSYVISGILKIQNILKKRLDLNIVANGKMKT